MFGANYVGFASTTEGKKFSLSTKIGFRRLDLRVFAFYGGSLRGFSRSRDRTLGSFQFVFGIFARRYSRFLIGQLNFRAGKSRIFQIEFQTNNAKCALFRFCFGKNANFAEPPRARRISLGPLQIFFQLRKIDTGR